MVQLQFAASLPREPWPALLRASRRLAGLGPDAFKNHARSSLLSRQVGLLASWTLALFHFTRLFVSLQAVARAARLAVGLILALLSRVASRRRVYGRVVALQVALVTLVRKGPHLVSMTQARLNAQVKFPAIAPALATNRLSLLATAQSILLVTTQPTLL